MSHAFFINSRKEINKTPEVFDKEGSIEKTLTDR
jgi:hypothetical protein